MQDELLRHFIKYHGGFCGETNSNQENQDKDFEVQYVFKIYVHFSGFQDKSLQSKLIHSIKSVYFESISQKNIPDCIEKNPNVLFIGKKSMKFDFNNGKGDSIFDISDEPTSKNDPNKTLGELVRDAFGSTFNYKIYDNINSTNTYNNEKLLNHQELYVSFVCNTY